MIAHEHFQKLTVKEFMLILGMALIMSNLMWLGSVLEPLPSFIISLVLLVIGLNFSVYLIGKAGVATLFLLVTSFLTYPVWDIGVTGTQKVLTYFLAGLLFEMVFLGLKVLVHNIPLDMVIGSTLVGGSIPLLAAFTISSRLAENFPVELINMILLSLSIGLATSVLVFLVWFHIENGIWVLKVQDYLRYY